MKQWGRVATIQSALVPIYICLAWLFIQVASQILPFFDVPNWTLELIIVLLLLGLPITLVLAWRPISRWVDSRGSHKLSRPPSLTPAIAQASHIMPSGTESVSQIRPWVRYCARFIDIIIFGLCLGVCLDFIAPALWSTNDTVVGVLVLFPCCFVEALCLSTWGTTPGKGLLRVSVRNADGSKLNYRSALSRSADVWARGLGAGLPLVSFIALIVAHEKLTKNGITTWDQSRNFSVTHERIGRTRGIVAILLFALFIFLIGFGAVAT